MKLPASLSLSVNKTSFTKKLALRSSTTKGFTLIELLVVISIIGILTAITIPQLTAFNRRQILKNAAAEVKNSLRFAQNKASAAEIDTSATGCTLTPTTHALRGWYAYINPSPPPSYSISGLCATPAGTIFGTRDFNLPSAVNISASDGVGYILFPTLTKSLKFYTDGTDLALMAQGIATEIIPPSGYVTLTLTLGSETRYVKVSVSGEIYDQQ